MSRIFDSKQMKKLEQKYAEKPEYFIPRIVHICRSENLSREREVLESIVALVHQEKQEDWVKRLVSDAHEQFLGAWFEIMLYDWLQRNGDVEFEPVFRGDVPDFAVTVGNQTIYIEAFSIPRSKADREASRLAAKLRHEIEKIPLPYIVSIPDSIISQKLDHKKFVFEVRSWLTTDNSQPLRFRGRNGMMHLVSATLVESLDSVALQTESRAVFIDPQPLQEKLHQKAKQHKSIRNANKLFVIAYFDESFMYTANSAVDALLGREVFYINIENKKVVDHFLKPGGLTFQRGKHQYRSVSGVLALDIAFGYQKRRPFLEGRLIQNIDAYNPVDPTLFPLVKTVFSEVDSPDNRKWVGWTSEGS